MKQPSNPEWAIIAEMLGIDLIDGHTVSSGPPVDPATVLDRLAKVESILVRFSHGDFDGEISGKGAISDSLHRFQAALCHLLQEMEIVANGDLEFKVGQFGQISTIFNTMTDNLRRATDQLVRQYLDVERLAQADALTGLQNRRTIIGRLQEELVRTNRYLKPLSVILMDLDDFKAVNDQHGHPIGDEVLRRLGDIIRRQARLTDQAGRFGGEEFIVVTPETEPGSAVILAERIRRELEGTVFAAGSTDFRITLSLGISGCRPGATVDEQELIRRADVALYAAKRAGKNRVIVYQPPLEASR